MYCTGDKKTGTSTDVLIPAYLAAPRLRGQVIQLVVVTATSITIAVTTAATAAVTTAATATVATTATAATAVTTAATATAATATIFTRLGFFHGNLTTVHFDSVQIGDSGLSFVVVRHLYEAETTGTTGFPIHNDLCAIYFSEFFEGFTQVFVLDSIIQSCNKNVHLTKSKIKKTKPTDTLTEGWQTIQTWAFPNENEYDKRFSRCKPYKGRGF